jgi:osmotically-inducible protein OsmY
MEVSMSKTSSIKACLLAAASLSLIGVAGCEKPGQPGPAETAGRKVDQAIAKLDDKVDKTADSAREHTAKAGQAMDDAAITAAIKAHILAEPGLKVLKIDVNTVNGVVTLSGSADSQQNVEKAAQIASTVQGVKSVDNRLAVSSSTTG